MLLLDADINAAWVSAIAAAIGVPFAIWSFVKLVIRDKDRQAELDSLAKIVSSQEKQIAELSKQTMILQDQLNLKDSVARANHKPEFQLTHQGTFVRKDGFRAYLVNMGRKAILVKFANEQNFGRFEWSTHINFENAIVESMQEIFIDARDILYDKGHKEREDDNDRQKLYEMVAEPFQEKFTFDLIFKDALGNCYKQRITGNENPGYMEGGFKIEAPQVYHLLES